MRKLLRPHQHLASAVLLSLRDQPPRDALDDDDDDRQRLRPRDQGDTCSTQVRFLMSVNASYCTCCGGKVRLFSKQESARFAESVQRKKYCSA